MSAIILFLVVGILFGCSVTYLMARLSHAPVDKDILEKLERELSRREATLTQRETTILDKENLLEIELQEAKTLRRRLEQEEETLAYLSRDEARALLIERIRRDQSEDLQSRLWKLTQSGEKILEEKARDILANAIYRIGNTKLAEFTTSEVPLESEEMKGKIIGKEGRNIKTFERLAGVDVLVDEAPKAIIISCFDPVRRAIATNALKHLLEDGRIQPAKIEECLEQAKKELGLFMKKKGEEALIESGLVGIPEQLVPLLGRLYFRTSYGQNVLNHSIEMAHIAGILAHELGVDVRTAKLGALFHDIGKAVDHEVEGTHVDIGRKILRKYGIDEAVVQAMQAHHEEYPFETIESVIVQVADAISGGRPGARRDTVERYIERLEELEGLARSFHGIDHVFALQAGREIRVFVSPDVISDLEAHALARDIALKIEQTLRYPGEIKIHVIRESRVIAFAR